MTRREAERFVADLVAMREGATDQLASLAPSVYPTLKYDGSLVKVGTRILHDDMIFKAAVDLWDTESNNPDNAPDLWAELEYRVGIRIIPETITVTTAFSENELGWWGDDLYKSKVNDNVYTPEQYPTYWELQANN